MFMNGVFFLGTIMFFFFGYAFIKAKESLNEEQKSLLLRYQQSSMVLYSIITLAICYFYIRVNDIQMSRTLPRNVLIIVIGVGIVQQVGFYLRLTNANFPTDYVRSFVFNWICITLGMGLMVVGLT